MELKALIPEIVEVLSAVVSVVRFKSQNVILVLISSWFYTKFSHSNYVEISNLQFPLKCFADWEFSQFIFELKANLCRLGLVRSKSIFSAPKQKLIIAEN